ncbi:MAG: hypothetical protein AAGC60_08355 [Acidobacteriota bacterium]
MLRTRRSHSAVASALVLVGLLGAGPLLVPSPAGGKRAATEPIRQLLRSVGSFVGQTLTGYAVGETIDRVRGKTYESRLEAEIAPLLAAISTEIGGNRRALEEHLEMLEEQRAVLVDLLHEQLFDEAAIEALAERQSSIDGRLTRLERRVDRLEDDIGALERRIDRLEDAYIAQCLDLQQAPRVGADGFHVDPEQIQPLAEVFESASLRISTRAFLDACTPDLTQRGMLVQLALITYGLDRQLELLATFKHLGGSFDRQYLNQLARLEIPVYRPRHVVDGQVLELFIPYDDIPFSPYGEPIAVAFVLTHDRQPLYSIPDQVIRCTVGRQLRCRWGR